MGEAAERFTRVKGKSTAQTRASNLRQFLRRAHPGKTAQNVAADCAARGWLVPARTIERWLLEGASPGFAHTTALLDAYGPDLLAVLLPSCPLWLDAAQRVSRDALYVARRAALEAEFSRAVKR